MMALASGCGASLVARREARAANWFLRGIREKVCATDPCVAISASETEEMYSSAGLRVEAAAYMKKSVSHSTQLKESTMTMTDLADGIVHRGREQQSLPVCILVSYDHPMFSHIK
jgi:hypothetical protein